MPSEADLALRIVFAAFLGAVIGLERELTGQTAGLRTHITISMGAALFAIASAYSFEEFIQPQADTNYQVDVTRIASNVVTGVGFLGGGAIIKHGASVSGLTTAASIWVTAALGLAVGLGSYFPATVTALCLIFVLTALRGPRRWLNRRSISREHLVIQMRPGADAGSLINELFKLPGVAVKSVSVRETDHEGHKTISAEVKGSELRARLAPLAGHEDISELDMGS
ncbi:MAG: MgtC/SapB family protein [Actinomycetota bacterium]